MVKINNSKLLMEFSNWALVNLREVVCFKQILNAKAVKNHKNISALKQRIAINLFADCMVH